MAAIRARVLTLIVGGVFVVPLRADLQFTVKDTFAGGTATGVEYTRVESTRVEYYKENRWRSDSEYGYRIVDLLNKRAITVDPVKREYSVNSFTHTEQITDPSQTIVIDVETRDTGERRQMFGHPARHFITIERRRAEYPDKPPSATLEIRTDGWYLDTPLPFPIHSHIGAVAVLRVLTIDQHNRQTVPKIEITRNGPAPHGLPVWEETRVNLSEVTEFSEASLDESLFEPPKGFRRVVHPFPEERLSWSDQWLFHWQQFRDWVVSLF
jgi:hypothetical protein